MKRRYIFIGLAIIIFVVIAGCNPASVDSNSSTKNAGQILFQDDFSKTDSGWETWSEANGSQVGYVNGGLRILIKETQYDYWSRPGKRFTDTRIEVDAIKVAGPDDNTIGILCRWQNRDNYYALLISSDGYYSILRVKEGAYELLGAKTMLYSESIRKGSAVNRLRADCTGNRLVFYANGQKLTEVQDNTLASGEVGLIAGTLSKPGVDIFFDNFVVTVP
jgi:hypothetical protein